MTLLSPLGLLWLGSVPVLLWLWRLASSHRQVRVPSLIPFERLLRRPPRRRTHLIVNLLFWLQLMALLGASFALAQPVLFQRRARTVLAVLDTSASLGAVYRGTSAFEHAKQALLTSMSRKAPTDQWFLMTTAPIAPVTSQPTSDVAVLTSAVRSLQVTHLEGNLTTTVDMGRALLAREPDETVIVTDEARPPALSSDAVQWITVGAPLPNVAIVGLDAQGPLCTPSDGRIVVAVQNFSDEGASVTVTASQRLRQLTETHVELAPQARQPVALAMPPGAAGLVDIRLASAGDGLEADNRAWVDIHRTARLPIVVRSSSADFTHTLSTWLEACPALSWTADTVPSTTGPALVMTDEEDARSAAATMVFLRPEKVNPTLSHWVVTSAHPISAYLAPVQTVSAALNRSGDSTSRGVPIVSALLAGRKVPIVMADEREGVRRVALLVDPVQSTTSTPLLLIFFNSLRWLMGRQGMDVTGTILTVSGFTSGPVRVDRPDDTRDTLTVQGEILQYEATTLAGPYRFSQGSTEVTAVVNGFHPSESNLLHRSSTWHVHQPMSSPAAISHPAFFSLSNLLVTGILVLLLVEWWFYSARGRPRQGPPSASQGREDAQRSPPKALFAKVPSLGNRPLDAGHSLPSAELGTPSIGGRGALSLSKGWPWALARLAPSAALGTRRDVAAKGCTKGATPPWRGGTPQESPTPMLK